VELKKDVQKLEQVDSKKQLGFIEAMAIVVGIVIGSGVFYKPSVVFGSAGAPGLGILAWIAGGVITMAAALTIAEIAAAIPKTGGLFAYLKVLYGERVAFLLGWVQTLVYNPGTTAALAIIFVTQATTFIPMTDMQQKLFAIFIIALLMIANIISTSFGGKIQSLSTVAKLIPIFAIVIFGLAKGTVHEFTPFVSDKSTTAGFGAAILGTLWAYDGWIGVGNIAGELKNPGKNLPRAIVGGLSIVMVVYVAINIAILNVLPFDAITASEKAASDAAVVLFGKGGAAFISVGIMVSIFGALNGYMLTGSRVPLAMAQDKIIPFSSFMGKLSKSGTPINALIVQFVLACAYVFSGSFNTLTDLTVFVLWIFFVMAVIGIFVLRSKHTHLARPYKVPLYPITPIIGIVGGGYILISTIITNTSNAIYGIGIALLGIPVYMIMKNRAK
jgi:basic amino acid/polyamine antiporter, APA family